MDRALRPTSFTDNPCLVLEQLENAIVTNAGAVDQFILESFWGHLNDTSDGCIQIEDIIELDYHARRQPRVTIQMEPDQLYQSTTVIGLAITSCSFFEEVSPTTFEPDMYNLSTSTIEASTSCFHHLQTASAPAAFAISSFHEEFSPRILFVSMILALLSFYIYNTICIIKH